MKHSNPGITNLLVRRVLADNLRMIHRIDRSVSASTRDWMVWNARQFANVMQWQMRPTLCDFTKCVGSDRMECSLPDQHCGDHKLTRFAPITLEPGNIEHDTLTNLADDLNDGEPMTYSEDAIRQAVWRTLVNIIDDTLEDLDYFAKQHKNWKRNLGDPDIDRAEEARLEAGDMKFDAARDARAGAHHV